MATEGIEKSLFVINPLSGNAHAVAREPGVYPVTP